MKIITRIHNHKIDIFKMIIGAITLSSLLIALLYYQNIWLEHNDWVDFGEKRRFASYVFLVFFCILVLIYLTVFIPIVKYLFFKKPFVKKGVIKRIKTETRGILKARYEFVFFIESEGKKYCSDRIVAYVFNDSKINYGDVQALWVGKEVLFYEPFFSKDTALIKRIIE